MSVCQRVIRVAGGAGGVQGAPIEAGQQIGTVKVMLDGAVVAQAPLVAREAVEQAFGKALGLYPSKRGRHQLGLGRTALRRFPVSREKPGGNDQPHAHIGNRIRVFSKNQDSSYDGEHHFRVAEWRCG